VTFSSDLVFDGTLDRPYTEDDPVRPLNVYGETKAEAERRVLDLLPGALVIRTSAFFGPWDDYNFLAALFAALDNGEPFDAPADTVVSPTYVPHLANAALDLLIDGTHGVWHLANAGAVTWHEFALRAASSGGRSADGIRPVATADAWAPARRPRYSALTSVRGPIMPTLDEGLTAWAQARREQSQTRRSPSNRRSG
jgi:dTDP-4-dehydrorhamnose reductase